MADALINTLLKLLKSYPVLDIGPYTGSTDYIDFIWLSEMTAPVMYGVDRYSRFFFVVQMKVTLPSGKTLHLMETFHERYTPSPGHICGKWVCCGHATELPFSVCSLTEAHFRALIDLLKGKEVVLNPDLYQTNFAGATIKLAPWRDSA